MRFVVFFLKQSRKTVLLSVTAAAFSGVCNAALIAWINWDLHKNSSVAVLAWTFGCLCALLPLSRFVSEFLLTKVGQGATYNLRVLLCSKILATPLRHLEEMGAPQLLATLTEDVSAIATATATIPLFCVNVSLVIGCLVYLGILSPMLLGVVLGFILIGIATYQLPIIRVEQIFELSRKDTTELHRHFRALIYGAKELKIHVGRRQAFVNDELKSTAESLRKNNTAGENLYSAAASWGQTLVFVLIGVILFVGPSIRDFRTETMVSYALTLLYCMTPLQIVLNTLPQLTRASVALNNTEKLGFALSRNATEEISGTNALFKPWKKLELVSVTHTYHRESESGDFVLGPIDLSFTRGELVFITGGNGSGKTTFIKLLTSLYSPEEGHIALDGEPIDDTNRDLYRQHFSAVFADFYLFDEMLGLIDAELDDRANGYLSQLKLLHKVEVANGKLSTIDLSQGQRKRLALLTAYLEDRPIYIFDEWAADQDPQFKGLFYFHLLPELKANGKTVFVVSHDDRYFHVADRLIKLEEGQVVSDAAKTVESAFETA